MTRADRFWTWLARLALRKMSNNAAWNWYMTMGFAYSVEPHLIGGDDRA